MQELLFHWALVILAQALSIGLTLRVDAVSWKWRRDAEKVAEINLVFLIGLLAVALLFHVAESLPPNFVAMFALSLLWLFIAAGVQSRQNSITFHATFYAALMQFFCFACVFFLCSFSRFAFLWIASSPRPLSAAMAFIGPLSALLTYALLSLFRPTIYGAWHAWRQTFRKQLKLRLWRKRPSSAKLIDVPVALIDGFVTLFGVLRR